MSADRFSHWPGEMAPISGTYRITHLTGHRPPHEALVIRGEELPPCRQCKAAVVFEVLHPASHMTHDWDFAGPGGLVATKPRLAQHIDTRVCRRYEVELPLQVRAGRAGHASSVQGKTLDLGEGGASVMMPGTLPRRGVTLHIELPGVASPLALKARVRHGLGMRYGFQFVGVSREVCQMLRQLLQSAAPA